MANELGALASEQQFDLEEIGRRAHSVLIHAGHGDDAFPLRRAAHDEIAALSAEILNRDQRVDVLLGRVASPILWAHRPIEESPRYERVLQTFLARAAELTAPDRMRAEQEWMLPDLAIAPYGVMMSHLRNVEAHARDVGSAWQDVEFWLTAASMAVVALLSALLVFGHFIPLTRRALRDFIELQDSLSIRTRYFYQMSHELRTPLNAINGYAEILMLTHPVSSNPRVREYASTILQAGGQLTRRIDDILLLAELQSGAYRNHPVDVDPAETARAALDDVGASGVRPVIVDGRRQTAKARVDRSALRTMLAHLLSNAIRHAREHCEVRLLDDGGEPVIEIVDDGAGLDGSRIDRLLQPFHTVSNSILVSDSGPGVGLAIVQQLATLNDAALEVEPGQPSGMIFRLRLQAADEPLARSCVTRIRPASAISGRAGYIL